DSVARAAGALGASLDDIKGEGAGVNPADARVNETVDDEKSAVASLEAEVKWSRTDINADREERSDLPGEDRFVVQVQEQVAQLDGVVAWHDRVSEAPLMRLLSAPLWSAWRRRSGGGGGSRRRNR